jgi:hypothetical protein
MFEETLENHENLRIADIQTEISTKHLQNTTEDRGRYVSLFDVWRPSRSRSSEWSLSFTFSHPNTVLIHILSYACYMPCPSHPP